MTKIFRPMKPSTVEDVEKLKFPLLIGPKYDGIRAVTKDKGLLSNTLKLLPNRLLQSMGKALPLGIDLEVCLTNPDGSLCPFNEITSWVMSQDKSIPQGKNLSLFVFDWFLDPSLPYTERLEKLSELELPSFATIAPSSLVNSVDELSYHHKMNLDLGYEGSILRSLDGLYKFGRSTLKEQYCLKLKPYEDTEGTIVGFEPRYINLEVSQVDERGLLKKGKKKANLSSLDMVGVIILKSEKFSQPVRVGTGFNHELAKKMFDNPSEYLGKIVKFSYLPSQSKTAYLESPRHPSFLGFRDSMDLTDY